MFGKLSLVSGIRKAKVDSGPVAAIKDGGKPNSFISLMEEREIMAKGQQRSNREMKKPKVDKKVVAAASPISLTKQVSSPVSPPKKKS